jgi:UDP-N-acetylglucosamine acyltransferase
LQVIGEIPQDLKFKGEVSQLKIGKGNTIREHVTINLGTQGRRRRHLDWR